MIEQIFDLPENVLGFKGIGEVTANDYQVVLIPALEIMLSKTKRVSLLYILDEDFEGFTAGAAWEDTKVGLMHLTRFERVAVVTDTKWIEKAIKAFGFVMPGEVRVYDYHQLSQAREWVSTPLPHSDLSFGFLAEQGVLILRPQGDLNTEEFALISQETDPHIDDCDTLKGVLIVAEHFPGCDKLNEFFSHIQFVKEHRKNVNRLAIVTNDRMQSVLPQIAKHFNASESQHYTMEQTDQALAWVSQG